MIDSVAWPTWAMPKKSMIAAALAAVVIATTLVTAPVPLVNDISEASAHTQRRCFDEAVQVPVYGNPYSHVPTSYRTEIRSVCVNEAHSHWWQQATMAVGIGALCTTFGVAAGLGTLGAGAVIGVGCAAGLSAIVGSTDFH